MTFNTILILSKFHRAHRAIIFRVHTTSKQDISIVVNARARTNIFEEIIGHGNLDS